MKLITSILAGAALALGAGAAAAGDAVEKGAARLAKMLEGRVAGEPVRCITTFRSNTPEIIDRVALVHRDGKTIYVGRPVRSIIRIWSPPQSWLELNRSISRMSRLSSERGRTGRPT